MSSQWGGVDRARRIVTLAAKKFGDDLLRNSCVLMRGKASGLDFIDVLAQRLDGREVKTAVEIGTCTGLSAAVLACFAEMVVTFDVKPLPSAADLWHTTTVSNQICQVVMHADDAKIRMLDRIPFEFAFIDGNHHRHAVAADFVATRKSGLVLFHDYPWMVNPLNDGADWLVKNGIVDGMLAKDSPYLWWEPPSC